MEKCCVERFRHATAAACRKTKCALPNLLFRIFLSSCNIITHTHLSATSANFNAKKKKKSQKTSPEQPSLQRLKWVTRLLWYSQSVVLGVCSWFTCEWVKTVSSINLIWEGVEDEAGGGELAGRTQDEQLLVFRPKSQLEDESQVILECVLSLEDLLIVSMPWQPGTRYKAPLK